MLWFQIPLHSLHITVLRSAPDVHLPFHCKRSLPENRNGSVGAYPVWHIPSHQKELSENSVLLLQQKSHPVLLFPILLSYPSLCSPCFPARSSFVIRSVFPVYSGKHQSHDLVYCFYRDDLQFFFHFFCYFFQISLIFCGNIYFFDTCPLSCHQFFRKTTDWHHTTP